MDTAVVPQITILCLIPTGEWLALHEHGSTVSFPTILATATATATAMAIATLTTLSM